MLHEKHLFYLILLPLVLSIPQINLHYTDVSNEDDNSTVQHDCLRVVADIGEADRSHQVISYCLSELPSKFHNQTNDFFPNFTFAELSKHNITSEQLYLWSTPIDLIEDYQYYLNQLSTSNDSFLAEKVFYNCTLPRFGPMCQYEFADYDDNYSSLHDIIYDFYRTHPYDPINFTCYMHLQCDRGPASACLDWTEVCNGKVDCLNGDFDEEHCWQLYMNECQDNEYQCLNGQCLPESFFEDNSATFDCLDGDDKVDTEYNEFMSCNEPTFWCEDRVCHYTALTTSCVPKREELLVQALFSVKDQSISDECWSALTCLVVENDLIFPFCTDLCEDDVCVELVDRECPDMLYIPAVPVLFGHIYFAYNKNHSRLFKQTDLPYPYVCYNNSLYDAYFRNASKVLFNHTTCYYHSHPLPVAVNSVPNTNFDTLKIFERDLWEFNVIENSNSTLDYVSALCKRSGVYQCIHSRTCIRRLDIQDSFYSCPYGDDETVVQNTPIELTGIDLGLISWFEDIGEERPKFRFAKKNISFQIVCDEFTELLPISINGQNETDETECEQWPCNNIYTRCNNLWNCPNGADEVGCHLSTSFICPSDQHICISPNTSQFMCLSIDKANNGKIDCLGGTDEPYVCRKKNEMIRLKNFRCMGPTFTECLDFEKLCDNVPNCSNQDDEQFCIRNRTIPKHATLCDFRSEFFRSDVELFLCKQLKKHEKNPLLHFSLNEMSQSDIDNSENNVKNHVISATQRSDKPKSRCHRGFDLRLWLDNENNMPTDTCFCPPSFYGETCQYQNQRVTLTIKFQAFSDSRETVFAIVISLIDDSNERIINSYEQFTYLSIRDCRIKFNIYLLYSTRPKNLTKNYSIHIDIYEKVSLTYRGSLLYPVVFPFLPVYRLATIANIPRKTNKIQSCTDKQCHHGQCVRYLTDSPDDTFCQCKQGWSGRYCTIQHTSQCSSDSLCIGVTANNRSICVCPLHKFGPRCLLLNTVCGQSGGISPCQHNGQCIPNDDYAMFNEKFTCICPKGFIGSRCETFDYNITLLFNKDIILSQSIFIHFIELFNTAAPARSTIFKTIPIREESVIIYRSRPFHLIFTELSKNDYYLTVVQKVFNQSQTIVKTINPSDRCLHISEVFNETFAQLHLIRRIKYYHLPCQRLSPDLKCFYDDVHLCLCYEFDQKYLANCLEFNHDMTFDCAGQSECEHGGQCFQDKPDCPSRSICVCQPCFYGGRCQFSTSGFGLSLDAILGYHIQPLLSIIDQPAIVQFTLAFTVIFTLAGLVNGIFSLITFRNKSTRQVGCGWYLLGSSISTICTMIMFGLKFWILLLAQMTFISNRSFLSVQCRSIDFLLRVCLNMDQWLNACVAMERAITAIKATSFSKKKSKQAVKYVIVILLIVIIGSSVYDSIYRHLVDEDNDDDDEKRIWCIASYGQTLRIFDSIIQPFHVLGPFLINLISAIILVTNKSRRQSNAQVQRTYKEILQQQCRQQKHLFTAPLLLVLLALPRIIIIFASKCMKSANDSWLYLIGYFISFIPPMLTFLLFVVPSKFYRKEFQKSLANYRTNIQRRLHLCSSR